MTAATINYGAGFDADYAKETATRMLIIRGREVAIEKASASITKGSLDNGGPEFWKQVLQHLTK